MPGMVRFPRENLVYHHPQARTVRVNPLHGKVPEQIADRSLSVRAGAAETVAKPVGP